MRKHTHSFRRTIGFTREIIWIERNSQLRLNEVEALIMASDTKEDVFKAVERPQSGDEKPESLSRREDLTAESEVKAPGMIQRAVEEVEAIASEVWTAIKPSKK